MFSTIIIGGGQAGLAAAHALSERGVDHVIFERGRIAERWRHRWDGLHLLTPNWMTRLPGYRYQGSDPDGFMARDDIVAFFEDYARRSKARIREGVNVSSVRSVGDGFVVSTNTGVHRAANVVIATGYAAEPAVPRSLSEGLNPSIRQIHSDAYRRADLLPPGGALVVGAGASGLQIACELRRQKRRVLLAVGRHARAVRRYRGRDIWWWLEATGSLSVTLDEVADVEASRRAPSLGLSGSDGGSDLDLGVLRKMGVETLGRVLGINGSRVELGSNLESDSAEADARLYRLLDRFDLYATQMGLDGELEAPVRPLPTRVPSGATVIDLAAAGITSVVWATGYRRSYHWLEVPVLDAHGEIIHHRGVTPVRGLYVLGIRFQWTRASHFIDGVGDDARYLADVIAHRTLAAA